MQWWGWVRRRLDVLFAKDASEQELDEEIRFQISAAHTAADIDEVLAALASFEG